MGLDNPYYLPKDPKLCQRRLPLWNSAPLALQLTTLEAAWHHFAYQHRPNH